MRKLERLVATATLALAVGACSESVGPGVLDEETIDRDVALIAAQATIQDVADMRLGNDIAGAAGLKGDVTRSRTVTFYDIDGNEMDAFDPLLTATVSTVIDVSGSREGDSWRASMTRHREMTLSGLEGEETERTWNGTGTDAVERIRMDDEAGDRSYTMNGTVTIADVVVGVPRRDHPWPLSGTITRHVEVTIVNGPNGDETRERTATITFDGTRFATLDVLGETFTIDLADREGRRPHRKRGG